METLILRRRTPTEPQPLLGSHSSRELSEPDVSDAAASTSLLRSCCCCFSILSGAAAAASTSLLRRRLRSSCYSVNPELSLREDRRRLPPALLAAAGTSLSLQLPAPPLRFMAAAATLPALRLLSWWFSEPGKLPTRSSHSKPKFCWPAIVKISAISVSADQQ